MCSRCSHQLRRQRLAELVVLHLFRRYDHCFRRARSLRAAHRCRCVALLLLGACVTCVHTPTPAALCVRGFFSTFACRGHVRFHSCSSTPRHVSIICALSARNNRARLVPARERAATGAVLFVCEPQCQNFLCELHLACATFAAVLRD